MNDFARRLLAWYDRHGRHDLPWQQQPTPYRVWVSEVMLQQTQVATVIPYFERFIASFPDVERLADATLDEVLAHWSGLGYYSRARNLHKAAQIIRDKYHGLFPQQFDAVVELPGIGRSTAGAILALACKQHLPILDGNVKRVLSRFHALEGWPGERAVEQQLWRLAEEATPKKRTADYTQAIMDLGATLCSRSKPRCSECPMSADCLAHVQGRIAEFPGKKPRKALPRKKTQMLLLENDEGELLFYRRPAAGIWGGLWSMPECPQDESITRWCRKEFGLELKACDEWLPLLHTFSHFQLEIHPHHCRVEKMDGGRIMEPAGLVWYKSRSFAQLGLPAPVKKLLGRLTEIHEE